MINKYVFRVDDICPGQDWHKVDRLFSIFSNYNIKPVLGVIPDNHDKNINYGTKNEFWKIIKQYQHSGWSIALHGFQHLFKTNEAGIFGINNRSEFSGLPINEQREAIKQGINIFKSKGLQTNIFMAPAHSLDHNTISVLREFNFKYITDGFSLFPYYKNGLIFVPQLFSKHHKFFFGIYTNCIHPQNLNDKDFDEIEKFIKENKKNIISFEDTLLFTKPYLIQIPSMFFIKHLISFFRLLRR